MCLALPAKVVELMPENEGAIVSLDGIKKQISLALVQDINIGDYVLLHVGYAINKISPEEAQRTLDLMSEAGMLAEEITELSQ